LNDTEISDEGYEISDEDCTHAQKMWN